MANHKTKRPPQGAAFPEPVFCASALTGFVAALRLVDHIDAAFATHNAAVTVPVLERAERIFDLHGLSPVLRRGPAPCYDGCRKPR